MTPDKTGPDALVDLMAVSAALEAGKPVDADVAHRVRQRSGQARLATEARLGVQEIGVQIIRESRDSR